MDSEGENEKPIKNSELNEMKRLFQKMVERKRRFDESVSWIARQDPNDRHIHNR